ncbi:Uncharacterized protein HZ326_28356 [Fusarium oxysporum f. sp. albedinis]|nr:Uncharacterized protein HZ326_28356 [Fusarium oxysporum f. sp. albedinis]
MLMHKEEDPARYYWLKYGTISKPFLSLKVARLLLSHVSCKMALVFHLPRRALYIVENNLLAQKNLKLTFTGVRTSSTTRSFSLLVLTCNCFEINELPPFDLFLGTIIYRPGHAHQGSLLISTVPRLRA